MTLEQKRWLDSKNGIKSENTIIEFLPSISIDDFVADVERRAEANMLSGTNISERGRGMALFCQECSLEHWGKDHGDMRCKEQGLYHAICERCVGFIVHDETGKRDKDYPILDVRTGDPINPKGNPDE